MNDVLHLWDFELFHAHDGKSLLPPQSSSSSDLSSLTERVHSRAVKMAEKLNSNFVPKYYQNYNYLRI